MHASILHLYDKLTHLYHLQHHKLQVSCNEHTIDRASMHGELSIHRKITQKFPGLTRTLQEAREPCIGFQIFPEI